MGSPCSYTARPRLCQSGRGEIQFFLRRVDPSRPRGHAGSDFVRRGPASPPSVAEIEGHEPQRFDSIRSGLRGRNATGRHRRAASDPATGRYQCELHVGQRCRHTVRNASRYRWGDLGEYALARHSIGSPLPCGPPGSPRPKKIVTPDRAERVENLTTEK